MTVHSTQLGLELTFSTTHTTVYTVPAGKRTIVKSILIQNQTAAAGTVTIWVQVGSTQLFAINYHLTAAGSVGDSVTLAPWLVLNAGQSLVVATQAGSAGIAFSGAELQT